MNDANLASGARMTVDATFLRTAETLVFDGSAESDGSFLVYGSRGVDTLKGGAQGDSFVFIFGRFGPGDRIDGGGGYDVVYLRGNYNVDFRSADYSGAFTNVESLQLHSATDTTHAGGDGSEFDYHLIWSDSMLAGGVMTINGGRLTAPESVYFDGSAETDGRFRIFGGAADDTLIGGTGNDILYGGLGADSLRGNGGADTFAYYNPADSSAGAFDTIADFLSGTDKLDLSRVDSNTLIESNQAFAFIGSNAFSGTAGELRIVEAGENAWEVQGDVNGDGTADLVIRIEGPQPIAASDIFL
jgi:Ca2+-binding RTX toxin-like protein